MTSENSMKLGPHWTKDELKSFYEAYQKQDGDWKKVVAAVLNNRSVDMVEALLSVTQEYLSLPEASADGLAALMTVYYSASESKGEGDGASGVTRGFTIRKLHDAEDIGKKHCTLILTEGDSAKHLVMAGLSAMEESERKTYGVYPLQGKLVNVRKASKASIDKDIEIQNIKTIIGLEDKKKYTTTDSLRYKHVMIMTDQDEDGVHIKGLLINFFHHNWPELLELTPPFLSEFRTPIVKVTKVRNGVETRSFYSMFEYGEWKKQQAHNLTEWETIHYKGLGTHTSEEGCEYFKHIDNHKRVFVCDDEDHGEAIDRAFNENSKYRKQMLENFDPNSHHETEARQITFTDFIEKDLASFFMANMKRSVPSMLDGLKSGQRKILYCLLKRSSNENIKVSQVSALVSEHCVYHHSEKPLNDTIIKMAQDHVGSNNLPLLQSIGQFGTRIKGGKDAANPRYLRTKLSTETRILFPEEDDEYAAFTYQLNDEERKNTEPKRYYPIVPMVLVNGCNGVASGWRTIIPNYNLTDVISNLERLLSGEQTEPMAPWYRGFKGITTDLGENQYKTSGRLVESSVNAETRLVTVTELPIQVWTNNYVDFLDRGMKKGGKVSAFIESYINRSDDTTVSIQIKLKKTEKKMTTEEEKEILGLTRMLKRSNMYLLDKNDNIKKYESPQQIIEEFYELRLQAYIERKVRMLEELETEFDRLKCKVSFVTDVMNGEFRFDIEWSPVQLYEKVKGKYELIGSELTDYSFLLDLPSSSFNQKSLRDLQEDRDKVKLKIREVKFLTPKDMWKRELKKLKEVTGISSSSAPQSLEGQKVSEPEGISMSSKAKRTRSPGSTSGEKERKR